ncbi:hypothetical protein GCM10011494_24300 [Novosphingobium endophyticum]|uniref:Uncharacterized protein n=1 Tax=Novosphingobium endophyticum TaxID=1955250 RepID=A0A916TT35_9SPHN|nr:hypothetical protein [Novosphingobium endophyticum]GGC04895.1 hypothetical protein GCM10011494_24300 [Novosphingobium endophyticum]
MHTESSITQVRDTILSALVQGLETEFGHGAGEALAQRFLEAEECDFLWDARCSERWLGSYPGADDDEIELERIAICGRLGRCWFAATLIVDGEGSPHGVIARRDFARRQAAERAYAHAR